MNEQDDDMPSYRKEASDLLTIVTLSLLIATACVVIAAIMVGDLQ